MAYYKDGFEALLPQIKLMLDTGITLAEICRRGGLQIVYDDDRTALAGVFLDLALPATPCNMMNDPYLAKKFGHDLAQRGQQLERLARVCLQTKSSVVAQFYIPYGPLYEALQPVVAEAKLEILKDWWGGRATDLTYDQVVRFFKRYLAASPGNTVVTLCAQAELHLDISDRRILTYLCGFVSGVYGPGTPANYEVHSTLLEHLITGSAQTNELLLKVDRFATLWALFMPCFVPMIFEDVLQEHARGGLGAERATMLQQRLATIEEFADRHRGINGQPVRH